VRALTGAVKHYDWGDTEFIPRLLGLPVTGEPVAEVWYGTHPSGPAVFTDSGEELRTVTGDLPFMVKYLAAARPLSLQVHPSRKQAVSGFARENAAGIALDDPRRTYRDESDKPEILIALTPFFALCGFHDPEASAGWFRAMGWNHLADALDSLGIEGYVEETLTGSSLTVPDNLPEWAAELRRSYPNDPAVLVALLMHWVELAPGECLSLTAGTLHAYLSGNAVEVMNGSDNVVRAGFTTKHQDRDELLRITDFTPCSSPVRRAVNGVYPSAGDFVVRAHHAPAAIITDIDTIVVTDAGTALLLRAGESYDVSSGTAFAATAGTQS
jgi:mannose-6-phosphate isomerase